MRYIYILLAGILLISAQADAQIYLGGEVGVNAGTYTGKLGGNNRTVKFGETFGFIVSKDITYHLSMMTGLSYTRNGYNVLYHGLRDKVGVNTFEIPLNLECEIGRPKKVNYFIGGGPYIATNVSGRASLSGPILSEQDLKVGSSSTDDIKRYDAGFGVWFVLQPTKGLFFRLRAQSSFFNLDPTGYARENPMRNQDLRLTIGYMFE